MRKETHIDSDILVIGGGAAAMFAAIRAREKGASVTVVDKGHAGYSGQSPYADAFLYFDENQHNLQECIDYNFTRGEYVANRDYVELVYKKSKALFEDIRDWGAEFHRNEDGSIRMLKPGPYGAGNLKGMKMPLTLRKHAQKIGVQFIDKTMMTNLLTRDGAVVGGTGISTTTADYYEIFAKAVIICTGASALKPNGWPAHALTGDGDAMAYRVGAAISGKEFVDAHTAHGDDPHYSHFAKRFSVPKDGPPNIGSGYNAEGEEVKSVGTLFINADFAIHEGKGPVTHTLPDGDKISIMGGVSVGMALHKAEGIFPKDIHGTTDVPGLYAAGDSLSTMQNGALYCPGGSLAGSSVTGAEAGLSAYAYAQTVEALTPDEGMLAQVKEEMYAPLDRKGGYSPEWVTEQLQNMMFPYYITYIKEGSRLEATLSMLKFYSEHLVPRIKANTPHELRHAHEVRNMVLNSEMKLRAGLARKESRGAHYREDYPFRDDENFLCWITLKKGADGDMEINKVDIPKEWLPENFEAIPYTEKYPIRILNEKLS